MSVCKTIVMVPGLLSKWSRNWGTTILCHGNSQWIATGAISGASLNLPNHNFNLTHLWLPGVFSLMMYQKFQDQSHRKRQVLPRLLTKFHLGLSQIRDEMATVVLAGKLRKPSDRIFKLPLNYLWAAKYFHCIEPYQCVSYPDAIYIFKCFAHIVFQVIC